MSTGSNEVGDSVRLLARLVLHNTNAVDPARRPAEVETLSPG